MRHHLLLAFLDLRLKGLASAIEAALSVAFSFRDRKLFVLDNSPSGDGEDGVGGWSESVSSCRGAEVGGGPLDVEGRESREESDRIDGESSAGVEGLGDVRSLVLTRLVVDMRGLWIADGTAEGYGLA